VHSEIVNSEYKITAVDHWSRCRKLLDEATDFSQVLYAALELRFCIERLCFQYLVLLTHRTRDLSKSELKLYEPKKLFQAVYKEAPYFPKLVDVLNANFEVGGASYRVVCPDVDWLQKTHGKLGQYLHAQKEVLSAQERQGVVDFIDCSLQRVYSYLPQANVSEWQDHTESIFAKYVEGIIDKAQMKRMLEIANIPHHMFNKPRWP